MKLSETIAAMNGWLAGSPSLNLVSLALAVVGIFASIYFYVKSRKEKTPVYLARTFPLIQDSVATVEGLSIRFGEKPISDLSLTRMAIWNKGRQTILGTDVARNDALRIEFKEGVQILGVKVSFERRPVAAVTARIEKNVVLISFDFLDFLDGAVFDLYHTGKGTAVVAGTIMGVPKIAGAKLEENSLLNRFVGPLIGRLPRPNHPFAFVSMFIVIFLVLMPVAVPLIIVETIVGFFQVVPKEYRLSE